MKHVAEDQVEGAGTTAALCQWVTGLDAASIPPEILERAKYLVLDGIGCGLVGSHVPWSEELAFATSLYEPEGQCSVIGHTTKYGPIAAATLNGAFIQATELDDYHSAAPLHSASVFIPTLLAAAEARKYGKPVNGEKVTPATGLEFLTSIIAAFESAPRIGLALNGAHILVMGWHSGPIFGAPAAALAASKLLKLNADDTESAVGIACTQAGGLMSAQYEGMIKRVQHSFAARNGLYGALLARTGYVGIKKVFERPYGGYLAMFGKGSGKTPEADIHQVAKDLGKTWELQNIRVKLYASVGGTHGQIELLERMQKAYPDRFAAEKLSEIKSIIVGLSDSMYAHCGWEPDVRPLTTTGAQMCAAYIGAVQLVDREVLLAQFADKTLNRDEVWDLVYKTSCYHSPEFDKPHWYVGARIKITFADGFEIEDVISMPKGYDPAITNEEIAAKFRKLAGTVIDKEKVDAIEKMVLNLEKLEDVTVLPEILSTQAGNALA